MEQTSEAGFAHAGFAEDDRQTFPGFDNELGLGQSRGVNWREKQVPGEGTVENGSSFRSKWSR